jgi:hypothetical protein
VSLTTVAGVTFPTEWLYGALILIVAIIVIVIVLRKKGIGVGSKEEETEAPLQQDLVAMTPVDQSGNPVMGRLLADVTLTERELVLKDPEILDSQTGEPKQQLVPYEDVVPWIGRDVNNMMVRLWLVVKQKGDLTAVSFSQLLSSVRQRFDPMETDPREVGPHYIGGPPRVSGVAQLLQSTTGKIIIIGTAWLVGILMGFLIEAARAGHV